MKYTARLSLFILHVRTYVRVRTYILELRITVTMDESWQVKVARSLVKPRAERAETEEWKLWSRRSTPWKRQMNIFRKTLPKISEIVKMIFVLYQWSITFNCTLIYTCRPNSPLWKVAHFPMKKFKGGIVQTEWIWWSRTGIGLTLM